MEYKFDKSELEIIIKQKLTEALSEISGEKKILEATIGFQEEKMQKLLNAFPLKMDLILKHWDILLDTAKSFLLVSSTVLVTSLALDVSKITTININLLRLISTGFLLISTVFMIFILYKRNEEKKRILNDFTNINSMHSDLSNMKKDLVNINVDSKELKEKIKNNLKKDEFLSKYLPDNF